MADVLETLAVHNAFHMGKIVAIKQFIESHLMFRLVLIVCLFALTACSSSSAPKSSVYEITGSSTARVARVSAIITKYNALPSAIVDARFVEEQIGDGIFGPSDFRSFCFLEVAPQDISQWTQILIPLGSAAEYNAPAQLRDWWVSRDSFAALQFYKPDILTGRVDGWIGISPKTGRIYIFTFTM